MLARFTKRKNKKLSAIVQNIRACMRLNYKHFFPRQPKKLKFKKWRPLRVNVIAAYSDFPDLVDFFLRTGLRSSVQKITKEVCPGLVNLLSSWYANNVHDLNICQSNFLNATANEHV